MKRIGVITATRAEYGLLKNLIALIDEDIDLELCLMVTGTHLSEKYGYTIQEIYEDGFPIAEKIPILANDSSDFGITQTMGTACQEFGKAFRKQQPDMIVVLGDRYELLPICSAAVIMGIPISHISGGEITEGAVDDIVRHCITKMSQLHFPGCEIYRKRIIQMGEEPERVFNYGDIGVENIKKMHYMSKEELEKDLKFSLDMPYACITFHPVTMERGTAKAQIDELLAVLGSITDMKFIITKANADADGHIINDRIDDFVSKTNNSVAFHSLGVKRYLSLMRHCEMIIGNSSSGIVEAPCFGIPTVNIGNRQKGRLKAESIIDCEPNRKSIAEAIQHARTKEFRELSYKAVNPYGEGKTSELIIKEVKSFLAEQSGICKHFYDLM